MELFLMYMWLQLPAILSALGVAALASTVYYAISLIETQIKIPAYSFDEWSKTEDGIYRLKYTDNPQRSYEIHCPEVRTNRPSVVLPFKKFYLVPLICTLFWVAIPNQTQTAVLVATSVALDIAKSPEGTKIGQLLRGKANELLDAELKKIQPSK